MSTGLNSSEQFVFDICRKTFLSLWSYANPQGKNSSTELCDVLIVCAPHVFVVSVKEITLKGASPADHERWRRKAVDDSIKQIRGAIRHLETVSFVTTKGGEKGLNLPPLDQRVYHRIAVALGGKREVLFGSQADDKSSIYHVFDEESFYLVLRHVDTVTDLSMYLTDKEALMSRAQILMSEGEENLLALYLHGGRAFPDGDFLILDDHLWKEIQKNPDFNLKVKKDAESYSWDWIIEEVASTGFAGDDYIGPNRDETERGLRILALEDRYSRRVLTNMFRDFLTNTKQIRSRAVKAHSNVGYVFFAYDQDSTIEDRRNELSARCLASLTRFAECHAVVGIGINVPGERSADGTTSLELVALLQGEDGWPAEYLAQAAEIRDELGFFKNPVLSTHQEDEFPCAAPARSRKPSEKNQRRKARKAERVRKKESRKR